VKLPFDHNLSPTLVREFASDFPGSQHVFKLGMAESDDSLIWDYARSNDFAIVSKDWDFVLRSMLQGSPPKVIYVQLGNCPSAKVIATVRENIELVRGLAEAKEKSYLILPVTM
jgi:predicted nuclease of predicted toxin-antitoxin system